MVLEAPGGRVRAGHLAPPVMPAQHARRHLLGQARALPAPLTCFVGREQERRSVAIALTQTSDFLFNGSRAEFTTLALRSAD